MRSYREIAPHPYLKELIECFWTSQEAPNAGVVQGVVQRVVPDGCADLIWSQNGSATALRFVGPMTGFQDYKQEAGLLLIGVRFRPALWAALFRLNAAELTDKIVRLEDISGKARTLPDCLRAHTDAHTCIHVLENWLAGRASAVSSCQAAIRALEKSHGELPLAEAAGMAGLSSRQFRRRCIETTGLPPKLLARILRFRRASLLAPRMSRRYADLAAECGYADQSHLIAEFHRFSGHTPAQCRAESPA